MAFLWKNTKTLDKYLSDDCLEITDDKRKADIVLIGGKKIDLIEFPNLKIIYRVGVGTDNIPFEEALERGIKVYFPSDKLKKYIYEETANFTCSLIMKMVYENAGDIISWTKNSRSFLGHKNLLIIGTGNIGKFVLKKMSIFMEVDTFDISDNDEIELKDKIKTADIISLHIPLNEYTKDYFDFKKLSWMKEESILINTSRGPIVNEQSLYKFISSGRIKSAFDVFWKEPYNGKLRELLNKGFFMTPHVASICDEFLKGSYLEILNLAKEIK